MAFIESFTRPFMLAVMLWPFLSFVLTLPVLALLYHRDNRIRFTSALTAYLIVLYLLALACFTMYPMPEDPMAYCAVHHLQPQLNPFEFIHDIRSAGIVGILQIMLNVVFFIPLGFFMKRTFRWGLVLAAPVAFCCSLLIETTQLTGDWGLYPCAYRLFDVDDLITNTVGALIGFALAGLFNRIVPDEHIEPNAITTHPGFLRRFVALMIDVVLIEVTALSVSLLTYMLLRTFEFGSVEAMSVSDTLYATVVMYVVFEVIIPWFREGRTLGGGFTRMTVETTMRCGWRRVAFYAVRAAVLYCAVFGATVLGPWQLLVVVALAIFWIAKRCMPYDLI